MKTKASGMAAPAVYPEYVKQFAFPSVKNGLDFNLVPLDYITLGQQVDISFCIPLPIGVCTSPLQLRIMDSNYNEIPSTITEVLRYRDYPGGKLPMSVYVRSVLVRMQVVFTTSDPVPMKVAFNGRSMEANLDFDIVANSWAPISGSDDRPDEYPIGENIKEPIVIPEFSPTWLCACNIAGRFLPIGSGAAKWDTWEAETSIGPYTWDGGAGTYPGDEGALPYIEQFGKTVVNDVRPHVDVSQLIDYQTAYEPWLYDRASLLWNLYIRTGKSYWFRRAHRATQFYRNHIDASGFFDLRAPDLKYSYSRPFLYANVLTGEQGMVDAAIKVTQPSLLLDPVYTYVEWTGSGSAPGIWTERHQGYGMMASITTWELTGDPTYSNKADAFFTAWKDMQENPADPSFTPANTGLWHTIMQHEGGVGGGDGNDYGSSPWMTSILLDAVTQYYRATGNDDVPLFMSRLGDFYANYVFYTADSSPELVANGFKIPHYFVGPSYSFSDGGDISDMEHCTDVISAITRCLWAKKMLGHDTTALVNAVTPVFDTEIFVRDYWIRDGQDTLDAHKTIFRVQPPRKFAWWINTGMASSYLDEVVNNG